MIPITPTQPPGIADVELVAIYLERRVKEASPQQIAYTLLNLAALHVVALADPDFDPELTQLSKEICNGDQLAYSAVQFANWVSDREISRQQTKE